MPITLDGTNGITTPTYGGADTSEYLVPVTQFKNRIINGAMVIAQRGTSFSSNGYTLDRWFSSSGTTGAWTVTQSSTAPTGYINSLLFTKTSGNAPASGDYNYLVQFVEGLNITDLAWGTANAQTVTLSFWVRSGATGTFGGSLRNGAGDYSYPFTYTVSSANTWEQKSVTIAGPTTGTWATTNAIGISVFFDLGSGTSARATAGAWTAGNFIGASGTSTYPTSTSSGTLQFTGVQLEVGSTATSFDYRPYGTELQLCQRYYFRNTASATNRMLSAGGQCWTTTGIVANIVFPVPMRVAPTALEQSGTAGDYAVWNAATSNVNCSAVPQFNGASTYIGRVEATVASGLVAGNATSLLSSGTGTNAYLGWSAEL